MKTLRSDADPPLEDPHARRPVRERGVPLATARLAMLLIHGRGGSAESMLALADAVATPQVAFLAPEAAGGTWYPKSFLAPIEENQPGLGSGLRAMGDALLKIEAAGVQAERTVLLGFSQGACLTLEFAARRPRRYGGVVALSGGLIGSGELLAGVHPDDKLFEYSGNLEGTPVFLGCSDRDPHIPVGRVRRTAGVMTGLGGIVTERIYPGTAHTVNEDELQFVRDLVATLARGA